MLLHGELGRTQANIIVRNSALKISYCYNEMWKPYRHAIALLTVPVSMQKLLRECAGIASLNMFAFFFNNFAMDHLFGGWSEEVEEQKRE